MLKERATLLTQIRRFFEEKDVLEVETPLLGKTGVCDPHLHNLSTTITDQKYYLQTSPEFAMKRLLASGSGSIYQICKAFRNDEQGRLHNPEFTLLEWYREGFDYLQLMDEIEELILGLTGLKEIKRITYRDAFLKTTKIDPFIATTKELAKIAESVSGNLTRNDLLDLILVDKVLLKLDKAFFLYDYPEDQAAMAKLRGNVSERFELIINGIELANGYTELIDSVEQEKRFENENKQRQKQGIEQMQIDQKLLSAMADGIPNCAGVALGLDRLLMIVLEKNALAEVLPFPIENT